MTSTDLIALAIMEAALVLLSVFALAKDIYIVRTERKRGLEVTITRGEPAMNSLYIMYGIATVVYSLLAQVAEGIDGQRVLIIAVNYLLLTHLFFFSQWFRNGLFFPMLRRTKRG
jgi:hypothetical protein